MNDFDLDDLKNILNDQSVQISQNTVNDIKTLLSQSKFSTLAFSKIEPTIFSAKLTKI